MEDLINALRDRRKDGARQAAPALEERRAAFVPGDRLHPVPEDVVVTKVTADGEQAVQESVLLRGRLKARQSAKVKSTRRAVVPDPLEREVDQRGVVSL